MGNFVCVFDRSGEDMNAQMLGRAISETRLEVRNPYTLCRGSFGVLIPDPGDKDARVNTWDSTAAAGHDKGAIAVLMGRPHLVSSISDIARVAVPTQVDVEHMAAGFARRGTACFSGMSGPFTFISFDPRECAVTLVSGHIGGLELFYFLDERWLIAASLPSVILAYDNVSREIDRASVSRYLGFRFPHGISTFFKSIKKLPPASWLTVGSSDMRPGQYWHFKRRKSLKDWSGEKVCTAFTGLLQQSIAACVDGREPHDIAVSLSGGLDSTSVAALAPAGTRLFSWYFDTMPECDERGNINALADHLGKPVTWVRGDELYPLSEGFTELFVNEDSPDLNPFAALKRELYLAAQDQGCRTVLVGDAGDALYGARDYWLRDSLIHGRKGRCSSLGTTIRNAVAGQHFARLALRRLLPVRHVRSMLGQTGSPWLTAAAHSLLPPTRLSPLLPEGISRYRFDPGVGTKHVEAEGEETRLAGRLGMERANPYWYWPLLEMVLNLPAYWFHRDGVDKILAREALAKELPGVIRESRKVGLLGSLFLRGIELNRSLLRDMIFEAPHSDWQVYVDKGWIEPYLSNTSSLSFGHTILWRVICYELWYRHLSRKR